MIAFDIAPGAHVTRRIDGARGTVVSVHPITWDIGDDPETHYAVVDIDGEEWSGWLSAWDADEVTDGPSPITGTDMLNYAALEGRPVTERIVRTCRERGHGTYTLYNGPGDHRTDPRCPRCGELREGA